MPPVTPANLLAATCALPAITGLLYYRRINQSFHPFIWAMCLSLCTETISTLRGWYHWPLIILYGCGSIYYILNLVFYLQFFYRQKAITYKTMLGLLLLGLTAFIVNCFFQYPWMGALHPKSAFFNVVILVISARMLNRQLLHTIIPLDKNPLFIIFCGILPSVFYIMYHLLRFFKINLLVISQNMQYANAVTYLIFFWAILCIPKKQAVLSQPMLNPTR